MLLRLLTLFFIAFGLCAAIPESDVEKCLLRDRERLQETISAHTSAPSGSPARHLVGNSRPNETIEAESTLSYTLEDFEQRAGQYLHIHYPPKEPMMDVYLNLMRRGDMPSSANISYQQILTLNQFPEDESHLIEFLLQRSQSPDYLVDGFLNFFRKFRSDVSQSKGEDFLVNYIPSKKWDDVRIKVAEKVSELKPGAKMSAMILTMQDGNRIVAFSSEPCLEVVRIEKLFKQLVDETGRQRYNIRSHSLSLQYYVTNRPRGLFPAVTIDGVHYAEQSYGPLLSPEERFDAKEIMDLLKIPVHTYKVSLVEGVPVIGHMGIAPNAPRF